MRSFAIVVALAALAAAGEAQVVDITPTVVLPSVSGRESFRYYCASCHGRDGRGSGPAASAFTIPTADLTKVSARNRGQFPAERLRYLITEGVSETPGHGSADMPVWGPIFRSLDPSDKVAVARIDNLVAYLRSIQRK